MAAKDDCNPKIIKLLEDKASTKQLVYRTTNEHFGMLKEIVATEADKLTNGYCEVDSSVKIKYQDKGPYEAQITFGGDIILFNMHTNVFTFEPNHALWKTGYIKEDKRRAYFGMINIYNFLNDSFQFNRNNDLGFLLGRIFINKEGHFFVEGKRQFAFMYNDIVNDVMNHDRMLSIIETAIIYGLEFDLTAPDFNSSQIVSVGQIQALSNELKIKTSKNLGFKFHTRMQRED